MKASEIYNTPKGNSCCLQLGGNRGVDEVSPLHSANIFSCAAHDAFGLPALPAGNPQAVNSELYRFSVNATIFQTRI